VRRDKAALIRKCIAGVGAGAALRLQSAVRGE
jgi:hypothetical protein